MLLWTTINCWKVTNSSWMTDNCQLISLRSLLASPLAVLIRLWQRICWWKSLCVMGGVHVIRRSECRSCQNICQSSKSVKWKSMKLYFKNATVDETRLHHFDPEDKTAKYGLEAYLFSTSQTVLNKRKLNTTHKNQTMWNKTTLV